MINLLLLALIANTPGHGDIYLTKDEATDLYTLDWVQPINTINGHYIVTFIEVTPDSAIPQQPLRISYPQIGNFQFYPPYTFNILQLRIRSYDSGGDLRAEDVLLLPEQPQIPPCEVVDNSHRTAAEAARSYGVMSTKVPPPTVDDPEPIGWRTDIVFGRVDDARKYAVTVYLGGGWVQRVDVVVPSGRGLRDKLSKFENLFPVNMNGSIHVEEIAFPGQDDWESLQELTVSVILRTPKSIAVQKGRTLCDRSPIIYDPAYGLTYLLFSNPTEDVIHARVMYDGVSSGHTVTLEPRDSGNFLLMGSDTVKVTLSQGAFSAITYVPGAPGMSVQ